MPNEQKTPKTWREITAELAKDVFSPRMLWALIGAAGLALCFIIFDAAFRSGCVNFGFFQSTSCRQIPTELVTAEHVKKALLGDPEAVSVLKGKDGRSPLAEEVKLALLNDEEAKRALKGDDGNGPTDEQIKTAISNWLKENPIAGADIPSGAVVAFLSSETGPCPGKKWKLFDAAKGRFIIGAGKGKDLTHREFGETDGKERVFLKKAEMPSHTHLVGNQGPVYGIKDLPPNGPNAAIIHQVLNKESGSKGQNKSHNNMPPYIALYYCKKD